MSKKAFLLDKPNDYAKLGINPNEIELWEDGLRDTSEPNHFEWWYFDCMMLYHKDSASGKIYPSVLSYIFEKNGTTVKYALKADKTIEAKGKNNLPFSMKIVMNLMHIQASYSRYTASGHLELISDNTTIVRDNSLIYEIMCPGIKCVELMEN